MEHRSFRVLSLCLSATLVFNTVAPAFAGQLGWFSAVGSKQTKVPVKTESKRIAKPYRTAEPLPLAAQVMVCPHRVVHSKLQTSS